MVFCMRKGKKLHYPGLKLFDDKLKLLCLVEIEKLLRLNGKSLRDFDKIPFVDAQKLCDVNNIYIIRELDYDEVEMANKHHDCLQKLNIGQRTVYDVIVAAVENGNGGFFFFYC